MIIEERAPVAIEKAKTPINISRIQSNFSYKLYEVISP
jgi:hypothetical protein